MPLPYLAFRLGAFLALILISTASQATNEYNDSIWIQVDEKTGLINSLPAATPEELIGQMEEVRSDLQAQKACLTRITEERKFSITDGLITIIIPGGLIYAAIIEQQHSQAIERMKNISAYLDDMTQNLAEYRLAAVDQSIMVAILQ